MSLVQRLSELVAFDSQNPSGDDRPICEWLRRELTSLGAEQVVLESLGRTGFVYAAFGHEPSLLINAHVDTVPANHGYTNPPHELVRQGSRCLGLGAADTKGAIAALLEALWSLRAESRPIGNVAILFSGDEELGGTALDAFLRLPLCASLRSAIVCEPTGCRVGSRHRGVASLTALVQGEGGHSAGADHLVNPVAVLCRAAVALEQFGISQRETGPTGFQGLCLNIASLEGGRAFNVVPSSATLTVSIRPGPGRPLAPLIEELHEIVRGAAAPHAVTWRVEIANAPFATRDLEAFRPALGELVDHPVDLPFWSEAAQFSQAGIDAVVFGPGQIEQAHSADEYVELEQLELAYQLFRAALARPDSAR